MKEFMFFIRKNRNSKETLSTDQFQKFLKGCETFIGKLKNEGKLISAQPIYREGKIISGKAGSWKEAPFDEGKEILGVYYHILVKDLEEAILIAKSNPEFEFNSDTRIEVRPIKMKEESTGFEYPTEKT
ncbi:MAG TPA: YciI family protein [Ignavibacteria bacterium]